MTRAEQLDFLIRELTPAAAIPAALSDKWRRFRSLVNMREPGPVSEAFLVAQDELLQALIAEKGVTNAAGLPPIRDKLCLWRGDITTLQADAIVNAANSGMLGCFVPCHSCIDNAIHTFAGVQLRIACADLMAAQGAPEPVGQAKITAAYNLPSQYVLHTVGPIVRGELTKADCDLLAACYRACLKLAEQNKVESIAFCCISTGEFHFPHAAAAEIAIHTVTAFLQTTKQIKKVIFNVFTEQDERLYRELLSQHA